MPERLNRQRHLARITAILVFLLSLLASLGLLWLHAGQQVEQRKLAAVDMARFHINSLQVQLERNLSSAYALAALIKQGRGDIANFDEVAGQLLPFYPQVQALALSPGGIITRTYPLAGNDGALGLNQLTHPLQRDEAILARDARQLTITGPVALAQGGVGLIGRLPVFMTEQADSFWGFVSVVLPLSDLLARAELRRLEERGYAFELWRDRPTAGHTGPSRQRIAGSSLALSGDAITETLILPNGSWQLSLSLPGGWHDLARLSLLGLAALLFSAMLAMLVQLLARTRRQARQLALEVQQQTRDITEARHQLEATLAALPDQLLELDGNGDCLQLYARGDGISAADAGLVGRNVREVLEPTSAGVVLTALEEAARHGCSRGHQFRRRLPGGDAWFELSVSRRKTAAGATEHFVLLSRDISERRRAELEAQSLLERYRSLITASNTGAWEYDQQSGELNCSQEYFSMLGLDKDDFERRHGRRLSRAWQQLLHPEDRERAQHAFSHYLAQQRGGLYENQFRMRHVDGSWVWILSRGRTLQDGDGQPTSLTLGTHIDITQQVRDKERIHFLAHFDALTGLPNRSLLIDRTEQAIHLSRREQKPLALLFLDLDRFKTINDSLGHKIGDQLLNQVAERLRRICRAEDTISRFGGDEFILVLPLTDAAGAAHFAQRLLPAMAEPYAIQQHDIRLSVSLGIALHPHDGRHFHELYHHADIAMYQAKEAGRNGYRFFTAEMHNGYTRMLALENGLRQAIDRQQLSLVYQPQYSLGEHRLLGFEALLRWRHPELGPVSPAEFIPIAEKNGFIVSLGDWVLDTALRQLADWRAQALPPVTLGINISAAQLRQHPLCDRVRLLLQETGVPAEALELELTESVMLDHPQRALAIMDQLHELGVKLALDDFGTGYSSLSYLKRFRLARLKIDQSFVRDLLLDDEDRAIVGAIISLARNLGLGTIAEGVESPEQAQMLHHMGCEQAQGYHLGRPMAAEQATLLLQAAVVCED
ncbi:diguanylate phosphodiesterase [Zobellella endophytica]|uniref:cyclic-guanylate-specific phosphodiesterase n=1 Tax=Zobellella endophytica TaxID=2116700 RepID=A0A2P7R3E6_9GAMM|nr:EAL domain-containing protein [Zobellella endophytica]PSJ44739.1 diguanylate phosphodiesterase [Zobellella endophytica]